MRKLRTVAIAIIALYARQGIAAGLLEISDQTTIFVSADEAWEEVGQDIFHFRGSFEIRTPRWAVTADEAIVYGKLDDLKRIVAEGSPVQFVFQNPELDNSSLTRAEGQRLEYEKEKGLLHLSGDAQLVSGEQLMRSSELRYDLKQEKLEAGGPEGVRITAKPKPRR